MIDNEFVAAMTEKELLTGEARHREAEPSRRLAMAAGLTKSSDELKQTWEKNPGLYLTTPKGTIAAYDENKNVKELLIGSIARLVSVVDTDEEAEEVDDIVDRAMEIITEVNIADQ